MSIGTDIVFPSNVVEFYVLCSMMVHVIFFESWEFFGVVVFFFIG